MYKADGRIFMLHMIHNSPRSFTEIQSTYRRSDARRTIDFSLALVEDVDEKEIKKNYRDEKCQENNHEFDPGSKNLGSKANLP